MKILMLSSTFPFPPTRGGTEVRTFNLLNYLCRHHEVTLLTQIDGQVSRDDIMGLKEVCPNTHVFYDRPYVYAGKNKFRQKINQLYRAFLSIVLRKPPSVFNTYSAHLKAEFLNLLNKEKYDVVTCEHSINEMYIPKELKHHLKVVFNCHSSRCAQFESQLRAETGKFKLVGQIYLSHVLRNYENEYIKKASTIVATTADDENSFKVFKSVGQTKIVSNGVDLNLYRFRDVDPNNYKIVFLGSMDAPHNIVAVQFFAREVFPAIQTIYPTSEFYIVGARPAQEVLDLASIPNVVVTGKVNSVVDYMHQATIAVVPLLSGYGIKNKTLEAMACGIPVVGTDSALEGLEVDTPDVPLRALRANSESEFVEKIKLLFENPELRKNLSINAHQMIEEDFTWERAGSYYEQVLVAENEK